MIALLGVEGLGREKRLLAGRSRGLQRILNQPLFVVAIYTAMEGRSAPIADTLAGCSATREAECDDWDEASLYTAS